MDTRHTLSSGNYIHILAALNESEENFPTAKPSSKPYTELSLDEKKAICEQAKQAVNEVGPRIFKISGVKRYAVIGCPGDGKTAQQQVADLIHTISEQPDKQIDLVIVNGDFFYPNGISSPDHPDFETFIQTYAPLIKKGIRIMGTIGNHDANEHEETRGVDRETIGRMVSVNLAARTFHPLNGGQSVEELKAFYNRGTPIDVNFANNNNFQTIPITEFPPFTLLYTYGLILNEEESEKIICLDSTELLRDYYFHRQNIQTPNANQISVLMQLRDAGFLDSATFVAHHPLKTSGKRTRPAEFDSDFYLTPTMIDFIRDDVALPEKISTNSYNEMLARVFIKINIIPPKWFAAHDHTIELSDNGETVQLICGAGGSEKLQPRISFLYSDLKYHFDQHGFAVIEGNTAEIYTTKCLSENNLKPDLVYDMKNHKPIYCEEPDSQFLALKQETQRACDRYLNVLKMAEEEHLKGKNFCRETDTFQSTQYISKKINYAWTSIFSEKIMEDKDPGMLYHFVRRIQKGKSQLKNWMRKDKKFESDIQFLHELQIYLDQPIPPSHESTLQFIKEYLQKSPEDNSESELHKILSKDLQARLNIKQDPTPPSPL